MGITSRCTTSGIMKGGALLNRSSCEHEIRCAACKRLLAVDRLEKIEIKVHDRCMRIYGWGVVCIDCSRCGKTAEIMLPTRFAPAPQNAA